jgi:hypothetical protein
VYHKFYPIPAPCKACSLLNSSNIDRGVESRFNHGCVRTQGGTEGQCNSYGWQQTVCDSKEFQTCRAKIWGIQRNTRKVILRPILALHTVTCMWLHTHDSELQANTAPTKPFSSHPLTTATNSGDSSDSRAQVLSSQPPVQNCLTTDFVPCL